MATETKGLSRLVKSQLQQYDNEIINNSAILMDASWWECLGCMILCLGGAVAACTFCCVATYVCCVCFDWILMYPIDIACTLMCQAWGKC